MRSACRALNQPIEASSSCWLCYAVKHRSEDSHYFPGPAIYGRPPRPRPGRCAVPVSRRAGVRSREMSSIPKPERLKKASLVAISSPPRPSASGFAARPDNTGLVGLRICSISKRTCTGPTSLLVPTKTSFRTGRRIGSDSLTGMGGIVDRTPLGGHGVSNTSGIAAGP